MTPSLKRLLLYKYPMHDVHSQCSTLHRVSEVWTIWQTLVVFSHYSLLLFPTSWFKEATLDIVCHRSLEARKLYRQDDRMYWLRNSGWRGELICTMFARNRQQVVVQKRDSSCFTILIRVCIWHYSLIRRKCMRTPPKLRQFDWNVVHILHVPWE